MRLVKFTDLGGNAVWVADVWVMVIRRPADHEYQGNVGAVLVLSGGVQAIQEDIDTAVRAFDGQL